MRNPAICSTRWKILRAQKKGGAKQEEMSLERHGKTGAASRFTEEATWVAAAAGAGATAAGAFLAASFNSSTLRFKAAFWNPGKHGTRRQWAICRRKRTRKRDRQRRQGMATKTEPHTDIGAGSKNDLCEAMPEPKTVIYVTLVSGNRQKSKDIPLGRPNQQ